MRLRAFGTFKAELRGAAPRRNECVLQDKLRQDCGSCDTLEHFVRFVESISLCSEFDDSLCFLHRFRNGPRNEDIKSHQKPMIGAGKRASADYFSEIILIRVKNRD
jgi:hypothetical protein